MKSLRILLILLVFIFSTADAKLPKEAVKKVGKRYFERFGTIQSLQWKWKSEEEQEAIRLENIHQIGIMILGQSSSKNPGWYKEAQKIESLMSSNFEGTICGSSKLTYVQFLDYWARTRMTFKQNYLTDQANNHFVVKQILTKDSYNSSTWVKFMVSFEQQSEFDYKAMPIYLVSGELRGKNEHNIYTILSIDEVGGCTEYGAVDWSLMPSMILRVSEGDPEEEKKVREFVENQFDIGKEIDIIPFNWFIRAAAKDEFFTSETCHDGVMQTYNKYQLIRWWKKFQLMWHPVQNQTNHTQIQLLGGNKGKYTYRLTMHLQIGVKPTAPVQEMNFKIQIQYNVHGDERWYINRLEQMCPLYSEKKLWMIHGEAIQEVIGVRLGMMAQSPEQWYYVAHFLDPFIIRKEINIQSCAGLNGEDMVKARNWRDIDYKFWQTNKEGSMKLKGYELIEPGLLSPTEDPAEKFLMEIRVYWSPQEKNHMHYSEWRFRVEWDERYQFYHLIDVYFTCPKIEYGNRIYQIARSKACRFKICTFILDTVPEPEADYDMDIQPVQYWEDFSKNVNAFRNGG